MNRQSVPFWRSAALLFVALRAADLVNVAAGAWLVPKYVSSADLGAVLPVVSFATTLATPAFAFAFILMREANALAGEGAFGRLKSLLKGAFVGTALLLLVSLAGTVPLVRHYAREMRVGSASATFMAVAAAFLGSFAPVYSDALNGLKRFGAYGAAEIAAALARVATMAVIMPIRALFGFFCGNAMQPVARILGAVFFLRRELAVPTERYWTRHVVRRIALTFLGVIAYLLPPMIVSLCELTLVRTSLSSGDSANYYLETRLTDLLGYLTLPILLVLFPYAAQASREGRSTRTLVVRSTLASLVGAVLLAVAYFFWGETFLTWFPHAAERASDPNATVNLLLLLLIGFCGAFQTFYTNAEIAAGRFRFLLWFVPLHLAYAGLLAANVLSVTTLPVILILFATFAIARALAVLMSLTHELNRGDSGARAAEQCALHRR